MRARIAHALCVAAASEAAALLKLAGGEALIEPTELTTQLCCSVRHICLDDFVVVIGAEI